MKSRGNAIDINLNCVGVLLLFCMFVAISGAAVGDAQATTVSLRTPQPSLDNVMVSKKTISITTRTDSKAKMQVRYYKKGKTKKLTKAFKAKKGYRTIKVKVKKYGSYKIQVRVKYSGEAWSKWTAAQTVKVKKSHTHKWKIKAATKKVWMRNVYTVEDSPAVYKEYELYRMYWYDTGTWEETRSYERFEKWCRSEWGMLYVHPEPEDDPLFLRYDGSGNPIYINDHAIISNLFDLVTPAVTHKEDRGRYRKENKHKMICRGCGSWIFT